MTTTIPAGKKLDYETYRQEVVVYLESNYTLTNYRHWSVYLEDDPVRFPGSVQVSIAVQTPLGGRFNGRTLPMMQAGGTTALDALRLAVDSFDVPGAIDWLKKQDDQDQAQAVANAQANIEQTLRDQEQAKATADAIALKQAEEAEARARQAVIDQAAAEAAARADHERRQGEAAAAAASRLAAQKIEDARILAQAQADAAAAKKVEADRLAATAAAEAERLRVQQALADAIAKGVPVMVGPDAGDVYEMVGAVAPHSNTVTVPALTVGGALFVEDVSPSGTGMYLPCGTCDELFDAVPKSGGSILPAEVLSKPADTIEDLTPPGGVQPAVPDVATPVSTYAVVILMLLLIIGVWRWA